MNGQYERLGKGIHRDAHGIKARVQIGDRFLSKRWPPDTDLSVIEAWRAEVRGEAHQTRREYGGAPVRAAHRPNRHADTLDHDAERYLPQIANRPSTRADRSHLRAWLAVEIDGVRLGTLPRQRITREHVNRAIAHWRAKPSARQVRRVRVADYARNGVLLKGHERTAPATSGKIASNRTIRHRCRVLADLYHKLDGPAQPTPVDHASVPKLPRPEPEIVSAPLIDTVTAALLAASQPRTLVHRYPNAVAREAAEAREQERAADHLKTYARFLVLVETGQRPVQVMRARRGDLRLDGPAPSWMVRAAKDAPAHTIPLSPDAVRAWQMFARANAWGEYDTSIYGHRLRAAGWPQGTRPYNVRHTHVARALASGVDLGDVQGLVGHTSPDTTRRFYGSLTFDRLSEAIKKIPSRGPKKTA
jgi:integrase